MGLKHQAALNRKLCVAMRQARRNLPQHLPPLFALTDPQRTPDACAFARHVPAGAGLIYRHFGASDRYKVAQQLARIARQRHLTMLIAADPKLAQAVRADGVHWPERQIGNARRWTGAFLIQTASAHSHRAIWRAQNAGMDAALVSTVFASNSPSAGRPMGPARLARLAHRSPLPLFGLGGVDPFNAARISAFAGLAAIEGLT